MLRLFLIFFVLSIKTSANTGLLGSYPFSGNAKDMSDHLNDGLVYGAELAPDRFNNNNNAYAFNGKNEIVIDADILAIPEFTWSVWVNPAKIPDKGNMSVIFSVGNQGADQALSLCNSYGPNLNGFTIISYYSSGNFEAYSTGILPETDRWYHLVFCRSSKDMKLYVDNKLVLSYTTKHTPYYNTPYIAKIGNRNHDQRFTYTGKIDDISLFNKSVDKCEVDELFKSYNEARIGYYPFSGNAMDYSGSSNHGVVYGAQLAKDQNSLDDNAYFFNGNASIKLDVDNLKLTRFSYSAWVNIAELPKNNDLAPIIAIGGYDADQVLAVTNNYGPQLTGFTIISYYEMTKFETYSTGVLPQTNTWYHLVFERGYDYMNLYVNGDLIISKKTTKQPFYASNSEATIGYRMSGPQFKYIGLIDEVGIYNDSLTYCKIQKIYSERSSNEDIITGITDTKEEFLDNLYPNPVSSGEIVLKATNITDAHTIEFIGYNGTLIKTLNMRNELIELGNIGRGIYYLRFISDRGVRVRKLIVQ
jgi:hypothetical protein